jgi:UDP-MurNAc hydroxylase
MQITYLGHAGFCIETENTIIIVDPWLSKEGAFDASWFQYPKNHHMADYVQNILMTSTKDKYIYISHEHKDHFDINFLQSLKSRDFTLLLANFSYQMVKKKLDDVNYQCHKIALLNDNENFVFKDGVLILFLIDTELNTDSAILIKSEGQSFLNINDCKIHDRLESIVNNYGAVDIFTAQFSGASWYPTCYKMTDEEYKKECLDKTNNKFESLLKAIDQIKPKIYLPSAGPPCFLDPMLIDFNFQDINSYPRAPQLIAYLDQHCNGLLSTEWMELFPGDALDVRTLKQIKKDDSAKVSEKDFVSYVKAYAKEYEEMFEERNAQNKKVNPQEVFVNLKKELQAKLHEMHSVNHMVSSLLYWQITECPEKMYCVDLAKKTIEVTSAIQDVNNYCRITTPAWVVNKVINHEMSWPDFALTFRLTIERVPDIYNTIMHGFLILETEKIHSFCEKMSVMFKKKDRINVVYEGKEYSVLRYCPHQGADLSQGHLEGPYLTCPRHQWRFDIENGGKCKHNETTIDAMFICDVEKKCG